MVASAGPEDSSKRWQYGQRKSMKASTRTGPSPMTIPSPSVVAPAGTRLGMRGVLTGPPGLIGGRAILPASHSPAPAAPAGLTVQRRGEGLPAGRADGITWSGIGHP